ncbi:MAG: Xylose isomerase-like TIM barrel [Chloroflexi bacterium ADurb.Bin325]|nr:MAG: Xylose isomerase-like TIM barrel [Chloroflexi bacterium ADurb.Bin325]
MSKPQVRFSVFTKPWMQLPLGQLSQMVKGWGFDGIELPVRPGYQVLPENVRRDLPRATRQLADEGLRIFSVAGPTDEATIAACAESGIPIIRIMVVVDPENYLASIDRVQREFDALLPILERYNVTVGIQNHCGPMVANAMGLRNLVGRYDPRYFAGVWDAGHEALVGEPPEQALDIIWSHLAMVNLKNAVWRRTNPDAEVAEWRHFWLRGPNGLASWPRVAAELRRRNYDGVVCLTAEYTEEERVEEYICQDIVFAKKLFMG